MSPVFPADAVPVRRVISPLTPESPALGVRRLDERWHVREERRTRNNRGTKDTENIGTENGEKTERVKGGVAKQMEEQGGRENLPVRPA